MIVAALYYQNMFKSLMALPGFARVRMLYYHVKRSTLGPEMFKPVTDKRMCFHSISDLRQYVIRDGQIYMVTIYFETPMVFHRLMLTGGQYCGIWPLDPDYMGSHRRYYDISDDTCRMMAMWLHNNMGLELYEYLNFMHAE